MRIIIIILTSFLAITAYCCREETEDCHRGVTIINNSDKAIYYDVGISYPDTSLIDNPSTSPNPYKIPANSRNKDWFGDCYEAAVRETLMVFIFDAYTLEHTPWDTVVENYMVLKRYDLSLDDLNKLQWHVTYP